jgi:hypothetical protein
MTARLERRYRRLLRAYPADYRAERGDEIVGTYLDTVGAERRWPHARDVADLLAGGFRQHLRARHGRGLETGAPLAATLALAAGTVLAAFWLLWIEVYPAPAGHSPAAVAWLAWLAAALVAAVRPGRAARVAVLVALVATVAVAGAPLAGQHRPPLLVLVPQAALGLVGLALPVRPGPAGRLLPLLAGLATAAFVLLAGPASALPFAYRWYAGDLLPGGGVALLAAGLAVAAGYAVRRDARGLWATLLLLPPVAMLLVPAVASDGEWLTLAVTTGVLAAASVAAFPLAVTAHYRYARRGP